MARLAAAAVGLSLSFTTGAGIASAEPDLGPVINTTCNYSQVVSALNAQDPIAAAGFNASPVAQTYLRGFLASSPDQRQRALQEMQSTPAAQPYVQQYVGLVLQVANTCNNY
ncbi:MAG: hemophore-related protein [Mycobacterium sp.]